MKQDKAQLTAWTVAKIAQCQTLNQAASLKTTMQHRGAYRAQTEAAYEALRQRLIAEEASPSW